MKDLCVPIPNFGEEQFAEIEIKIGEKRHNLSYRVVSFPWEVDEDFTQGADELEQSLAKIYRLKKAIEGYDMQWELIQIFNPAENANHIQVLYRKKK